MKTLIKKLYFWIRSKSKKMAFNQDEGQSIVASLNTEKNNFDIDYVKFAVSSPDNYNDCTFLVLGTHRITFKILYRDENVDFYFLNASDLNLETLGLKLTELYIRLQKHQSLIAIAFKNARKGAGEVD